jgi:hypothetical protein
MRVISSGHDGVYVNTAGWTGLRVDTAVYDGVRVYTAGSPSTATSSLYSNGFEVAGAQGDGLYVGRADWNGVTVASTGRNGLQVESAAGNGVIVNGAAVDGVGVYGASHDGVYANTNQISGQWGIYTPDAIHGSNVLLHSLSLVALVDGPDSLTAGDVVAVAGIADPIAGSMVHVPLVHRANGSATGIAGVVQSRLVLAEKPAPVEPLEDEARTGPPPFELRSANGPAQAGDYVAITVLGAAQVKAQEGEVIDSGQRLTVSDTPGQVRALRTVQIEGVKVDESGPALGVALEPARDGLVWVLVNPQ